MNNGDVNKPTVDMSTDTAWEEWGKRDPYYGVITDPKFRRSQLDSAVLGEFFESGRNHVDYVMQAIHRDIDPTFAPKAVLDFGCGVGRTLPAFAGIAENVVGVDVSQSMLEEAARNCHEQKLTNVHLIRCDDSLAAIGGTYDLIHSFIVFQHIPRARGRVIFTRLLQYLGPTGIGAIHFTYSKSHFSATNGLPPQSPSFLAPVAPLASPCVDPEMQMNPYNMNEILFILQSAGIKRVRAEYTDHGGELGIFLFFQRSSP